MIDSNLVSRIIYTDKRYGHKRHPAYIKNALGYLGYNTRAIKKCGYSINQFLQMLPRPVLVELVERLEGGAK